MNIFNVLIRIFSDVFQKIVRKLSMNLKYSVSHSLKLRPGGGLIPKMIQVCDYNILIVLVELNTGIGEASQRVAKSEISAL